MFQMFLDINSLADPRVPVFGMQSCDDHSGCKSTHEGRSGNPTLGKSHAGEYRDACHFLVYVIVHVSVSGDCEIVDV
jgi:hypothetical protein